MFYHLYDAVLYIFFVNKLMIINNVNRVLTVKTILSCRLKPNGEEIVESPKYSMNTTVTSTVLRIRSLNVLDMGNYTLEAKNEYETKKMNFTLDIMGIVIKRVHLLGSNRII